MFSGLDAITFPLESFTYIVAASGKSYFPTSSVAEPAVTDELVRVVPDESTSDTVAAFDGLPVTWMFSSVVT